MLYWIPIAFIRIVVFFIAGIVAGVYAPAFIPFPVAVGIAVTLFIFYFICWYLNHRARRVIFNAGIIGLAFIFVSGYLRYHANDQRNYLDHFSHYNAIEYVKGRVIVPAVEKERFWKQVVEVSEIHSAGGWSHATGKVMMYFPKRSHPKAFSYGDVILVKCRLSTVPPPANPGEFDYQKFLSYKNIFHQAFVRNDHAVLIGKDVPNRFVETCFNLRRWAQLKLESGIEGKQEKAIAAALVLGITDGLDNELTAAYSSTGAMHVLAVSGLHVAIIYMLLGLLIKPFLKIKGGPWLVAVISVFVLWGYACVTGLSPSVLRAVTMFSFMAVARPLKRSTNIYNTLGASAFVLLVVDPALIMSVGFQLSYLAVIGIVYFQPRIYRWFEHENYFVDQVWKITSVSVAAQLATFPLTVFYFHQFPNYFLLSNLFVIPLAFVVQVGGLAVLGLVFSDAVFHFGAHVLEWSIALMNYLIFLVDKLPFAVTANLNITFFQCLVLSFLIVSASLFLDLKKQYYLYGFYVFMALFSVSSWCRFFGNADPSITVYSVNGHNAIDIIDDGRAYFISDSALGVDALRIKFHLSPNRVQHGVTEVVTESCWKNTRSVPYGKIIEYKGRMILIVEQQPQRVPESLQVDYLIVSREAIKHIDQILSKIKAKEIILDSSNSYFVADKALNSLTRYQIHSVWHHGAFDKKL